MNFFSLLLLLPRVAQTPIGEQKKKKNDLKKNVATKTKKFGQTDRKKKLDNVFKKKKGKKKK